MPGVEIGAPRLARRASSHSFFERHGKINGRRECDADLGGFAFSEQNIALI